ncbi:CehA/McbA family metallohydrolase [Pseudothermotoga sp. U03pept]|uniref:CehA/McbA family metallohydrolase n=1 Tax=Pseudothermotoga sp. U03pept TaxID=3447012 RepID=UPI003F05C856
MKRSLILSFLFLSLVAAAYNFYFANLHSHTSFSDGQGTPSEAYQYAKDYVDILAVTDHAYYFRQKIDGQDKLIMTKIAAQQATADSFLGLWGFEWTGGVGHINVYGTSIWTDRNESDLKALYKWIVDQKALAQFNHPGVTYGNFYDFEYDLEADEYINLIEVGNGNTSRRTITKEMYSNYRLALDKGWHVGATANQDNHRANWGSANDTRTVIVAESLSYESIMEALKNKRTYASEDKNVRVTFKCNDQWMGSILKDATQLTFDVELVDDEPFYEAVIVSQSGDVKNWRINSNRFKAQYTCEPTDGYEWYFLYVIQNDWDEIITAPIWVQHGDLYVVNLRTKPQGTDLEVYFDLINSSYEQTPCDLQVIATGKSQQTQVEVAPRTKKEIAFQLKDLPVGTHRVTVLLNGKIAQTGFVEIKKAVVLIDQSHENAYRSFYDPLKNQLEKEGFQVAYNMTFFKRVPSASCVVIGLPNKGAFAETMALNDFEIENLVSFVGNGGKVVFVAFRDSVVEPSYNKLLERLASEMNLVQREGRTFAKVEEKLLNRYAEGFIFFIYCEQPQELVELLREAL